MKISYRKNSTGVEIVRIWSDSDVIKVPDRIEHEPVTGIAPYTFSNHKYEEDQDVLTAEQGEEPGAAILRAGGNIREVHLPETVTYIGNYAFYGCTEMTTFHCSDKLIRMGSGVFTGCRLSRVEIDFSDGDKSCLKEILTEIRYEIVATLNNLSEEYRKIKIVFPEHYLDAVENTPARIVENRYYGSGGEYRECFYRKALDFQKYDQVYSISKAKDDEKATAGIAILRMKYPFRLEKKTREIYEDYVKDHMDRIVEYLLEAESNGEKYYDEDVIDLLEFCCREQYFNRDSLEKSIEKAVEAQQTEMMSVLMNARHKYFPQKRKTFEL